MKKLLLLLVLFVSFSIQSQTNEVDETINLGLSNDATVTGSVTGGKGIPTDILYNPQTGNYAQTTNYAEYGVSHNQNLGLITKEDAFFWQVQWPSSKRVNYFTIGGSYENQPQEFSMWEILYYNGSIWKTLDSGQGGWLHNEGIYVYDENLPIHIYGLKVIVYSDGVHPIVSIHLRGRGVDIYNGPDNSATKAILIQLRPFEPEVVEPPFEYPEDGIVDGTTDITCNTPYSYLKRNQEFTFEHLEMMSCNFMLLQDNTVITLSSFTGDGNGRFIRADAGGGIEYPELGIDRRPGDVNPKIILIGPKVNNDPFPFILDSNIDIIDNRF